MEVELTWMELKNGAIKRQLLFKELRGISRAWRSEQKTQDMWANCVLKHCLSLKTFIPNFVGFFVLLGIVISCIHKMLSSVTSATAKQEFTPASHCFIIHLLGGGQCPLVRDSKPIRLLEIPTWPSLYMPIIIINIFIAMFIYTFCMCSNLKFPVDERVLTKIKQLKISVDNCTIETCLINYY